MHPPTPNTVPAAADQHAEAAALALAALGWLLSDPDRAARLLVLTGLDADGLRAALPLAVTQSAIIGFLEQHEPDLVACAAALEITPDRLVAARRLLETTL